MNPPLTIRNATPGDAAILAHLIRASYLDVAKRFALTPQNCPKHPSNCTQDWVAADMDRGVVYFILEQNDEPIGCVGLEQSQSELFYLERLAVLPAQRRQGFGRNLAQHAIKRAKAGGARQISIGIIADQTELRQWYAELGFMNVKTQHFSHLPFAVRFMEYTVESGITG